MLTNREVILAKIEGTYGVDPSPVAANDAVLVSDLSWQHEGLRMNERNTVRANIGKQQQIYGGRLATVTFTVELKGSGTAGTAPEYGPLLRSCALGETIVASTSVTYAPVSSSHESCTIYFYRDGKLIKLTGCRGNVAFALETGAPGKATFTMTGHITSDAETDATLVTPTYDSTVPPPAINASFAIGGYSAVINALNFDMGNAMAFPPDMSASDGYSQIRVTARDVNGSFDPEDTLVATNDWMGDLTGGSSLALATGTIGATAGNKYAISMPAVYYRDLAPGDRDGVRTLDVTFGAVESSGDDDVSIAFT